MIRITVLVLGTFWILQSGYCLDTNTKILSSTIRPFTHEKFSATAEGLTKRNVKVEEISKSLDSQQEFYRGPSSSYDQNRNVNFSPSNGGSNAINNGRPSSYSSSSSALATHNYDTTHKYPPKGGQYSSYSDLKNKNVQDRLSLGHGGNSYLGGGGSYGAYGNSIPVDFSSSQYGSSGGQYHGSNLGGYDHKGYDDYGDYGHGNSYLSSYGHGGGGGGGDYYGKAELAKKFLLPLAGIAVLGVAAALFANPLLLQLGTVSSPFGKKRRRRDLSQNQIENTNEYLNAAQLLAYKGHKKDV